MKKISMGVTSLLLTLTMVQTVGAMDTAMTQSQTMTQSMQSMTEDRIMDPGVMVGGAMMVKTLNIVENAVKANNVTTLVAAVKAAGLVDTLSGKGPFTVFAPTNDAFSKLPVGTVDNLLKSENKAKLSGILTYHVVAGTYLAKDLYNGQTLTTVNGQTLKITVKDGKVMVNGTAMVETADVVSSNGVTHVINNVLLPAEKMVVVPTPVVVMPTTMTPFANPIMMMPDNSMNIGQRLTGLSLNVRSWAGIGSNVIGALPKNSTVLVHMKSANGYWCNIDFKNAKNAWVACRYLRK